MDVTGSSSTPSEVRIETLYYQDGDIVLSAPKDAQTTWLFRVDKVFLARHSVVFRDMLSLPAQSHAINEQYDGVPRVHLADDAGALSQLLLAMYDLASLPLQKPSTNLPEVIDIMRLAIKYEVASVQVLIKRHVESEWDIDLANWERRYPTSPSSSLFDIRKELVFANDLVPEPASALRFAIDFGCADIIPKIMFDLSVVPTQNVWRHKHSGDEFENGVETTRHARWHLLQASEMFALCRGKEEIGRRWAIFLELDLLFAIHDVEPHSGRGDCLLALKKHKTESVAEIFLSQYCGNVVPNPLRDARALYESIKDFGICDMCTYSCKSVVQDWVQTLWNDLPEIFTMESWEDSDSDSQ